MIPLRLFIPLAASALLAAVPLVEGQDSTPAFQQTTDAEAGIRYETLSNGFAPWRDAYVSGIHHFSERKVLYGAIDETSRFSMLDSQATAGLYYPLGRSWTGVFEGDISPTHNILPAWSGFGQIDRSFRNGWGADAGVRHRKYEGASVYITNAGVEKYIRSFHLAYTLYESYLKGAGASSTSRVEADYYYGRNSISLNAAAGSELDNIFPAGVVQTPVKLMNLNGTHWFAPAWAVSFSVSGENEGRFYNRRGFSIGLRRKL
ncbi:MAG TPA: YaiO family outer membrane beta-barrel protein [Terriglobia bacterium]|jgi:YaiO family outer membrane protein